MTLRHLQIFTAVADLGSMTAAADYLHISQPSISQAVAEFELQYGVKLFDRLSRKLYLTQAGKDVLEYARHITRLFTEMEQKSRTAGTTGKLRIGASLTIGSSLLPKLVERFSQLMPGVQVHVVIRNTAEIEALIMKNMLDFALIEGRIESQGIIDEPFMEDELVLVCGKSHRLWTVSEIEQKEMETLKFIVRESGSGTRELFESVLVAHELGHTAIWESSSLEGIKRAVSAGIGVTVISRRLVERENAAGELRIIPVRGLHFPRKFSIIHHKNKYITESIRQFFTLVKNM